MRVIQSLLQCSVKKLVLKSEGIYLRKHFSKNSVSQTYSLLNEKHEKSSVISIYHFVEHHIEMVKLDIYIYFFFNFRFIITTILN